MDDDGIDIGSVVRLKSGGPPMTVTDWLAAGDEGVGWGCCWFVGDEQQYGEFPDDALEVIKT